VNVAARGSGVICGGMADTNMMPPDGTPMLHIGLLGVFSSFLKIRSKNRTFNTAATSSLVMRPELSLSKCRNAFDTCTRHAPSRQLLLHRHVRSGCRGAAPAAQQSVAPAPSHADASRDQARQRSRHWKFTQKLKRLIKLVHDRKEN